MAASDDLNIEFLTIPQGSNWRRAWPILDEDTGEPLNLTDATAKGAVAAYPGATPYHEFTTINGGIEIDTNNSYVILNITPEVSNSWTSWRQGVYDIVLTEASGTVTRIVQGVITINPGVTS